MLVKSLIFVLCSVVIVLASPVPEEVPELENQDQIIDLKSSDLPETPNDEYLAEELALEKDKLPKAVPAENEKSTAEPNIRKEEITTEKEIKESVTEDNTPIEKKEPAEENLAKENVIPAITTEKELTVATAEELPVTTEKELSVVTEKESPVTTEKELPVTTEKESPVTTEKELPVTTEKELSITTEKELSKLPSTQKPKPSEKITPKPKRPIDVNFIIQLLKWAEKEEEKALKEVYEELEFIKKIFKNRYEFGRYPQYAKYQYIPISYKPYPKYEQYPKYQHYSKY